MDELAIESNVVIGPMCHNNSLQANMVLIDCVNDTIHIVNAQQAIKILLSSLVDLDQENMAQTCCYQVDICRNWTDLLVHECSAGWAVA